MVTSPLRVGLLQFLQQWPSKQLCPASAHISVSVGILGVLKGQLCPRGFTTLHLRLTQTSEQCSDQILLSLLTEVQGTEQQQVLLEMGWPEGGGGTETAKVIPQHWVVCRTQVGLYYHCISSMLEIYIHLIFRSVLLCCSSCARSNADWS